MSRIRKSAVAGTFYPADPEELESVVEDLLAQVASTEASVIAPKAIIVPHAGYIYSGPVAASAFSHLKPAMADISRVVLLGPAHRVSLRGLALPGSEAFATPLGTVAIDPSAARALRGLPQVSVSDTAHATEHSLEVQLPFLQALLSQFQLVPLVVGQSSAVQVAEVLERLWAGPETLIVVSSDLSHYHDYQTAQRMDRMTSDAIERLAHEELGFDQACGRLPVSGLLLAARRRAMTGRTVDLRNSGDTAGPRDRVVGYGAYVFYDSGGRDRDTPTPWK